MCGIEYNCQVVFGLIKKRNFSHFDNFDLDSSEYDSRRWTHPEGFQDKEVIEVPQDTSSTSSKSSDRLRSGRSTRREGEISMTSRH